MTSGVDFRSSSVPITRTMSPAATAIPLAYSSVIPVRRISGPFVSMMMAICSETWRTLSTIFDALSGVTWAELIRTAFIPAS